MNGSGREDLIKHSLWLFLIAVALIFILLWSLKGKMASFLSIDRSDVIQYQVSDVTAENDGMHRIQEVLYHKEGIEASYPSILSGDTADKLEDWNRIIKEDFDRILQIYSFQPFPELTPGADDGVPSLLLISYDLKSNTEEWLSIIYYADYSSAYSAHPSNLIYTTNIDKRGSRRLRLSDILDLNKDFVQEFRTWEWKGTSEESGEIKSAIYQYVENITDEELLEGFRGADQIGSGNPWGIYSYLTQNGLGISLEVPHYAGDHAEFEQSFARLEKYLKPEFASLFAPISY